MLDSLNISNFAIIDFQEINFKNGFTVITGETGTGKSIIIKAVSLLMGDKSTNDYIREGETELKVEALISDDPVKELIISRVVKRDGKSRCYSNGNLDTLTNTSNICANYIDLHGQNTQQKLLIKENQLDLLDHFGGTEVLNIKNKFNILYRKYKQLDKNRKELAQDHEKNIKQKDFLQFQIDEILSADIKEDEYIELENKKKIIDNQHNIRQGLKEAIDCLNISYEGIPDEVKSVIDNIVMAEKSLKMLKGTNDEIDNIVDNISGIRYELEELIAKIKDIYDGVGFSQSEKEYIEERIYLLNNLKRKYGGSISEINKNMEVIRKHLKEIEDFDFIVKEIDDELKKLKKEMVSTGNELTGLRTKYSKSFSEKIINELKALNMDKAKFEVKINSLLEATENGYNDVEFMIAPNPGEGLKAVEKIASGGELSRIMLAIKSITREKMKYGISIFDEIDAGIGGKTALVIGKRLAELAKDSQVICITHLPQIGVYADNHIVVEKITDDKRTFIKVRDVSEEEKIDELSRMSGAKNDSKKAREHIMELMKHASKK